MQQVRVNLTFEREMWTKFGELVPNRKKSRIVNDLLKNEVAKRIRQNEEDALCLAFEKASADKERESAISPWESLDTEGWD